LPKVLKYDSTGNLKYKKHAHKKVQLHVYLNKASACTVMEFDETGLLCVTLVLTPLAFLFIY